MKNNRNVTIFKKTTEWDCKELAGWQCINQTEKLLKVELAQGDREEGKKKDEGESTLQNKQTKK